LEVTLHEAGIMCCYSHVQSIVCYSQRGLFASFLGLL